MEPPSWASCDALTDRDTGSIPWISVKVKHPFGSEMAKATLMTRTGR